MDDSDCDCRDDEIARLSGDLADAQAEYSAYRNNLLRWIGMLKQTADIRNKVDTVVREMKAAHSGYEPEDAEMMAATVNYGDDDIPW